GAIRYTATVSSASASDVAVTLSNGQTITILAGTTSGRSEERRVGEEGIAQGSVSTGAVTIATATGGNYEVLNKVGSVSTDVTDNATASPVTLTAPVCANEGGAIRYTATVSSASASDVAVTLSNGQTITILAGTTSG